MTENGGANGGGLFGNVSPEEIVLIAALFAIAIAGDMSDSDATSLAFFLSTVSSNIGLYIDRRAGTLIPETPGVGPIIPGLG